MYMPRLRYTSDPLKGSGWKVPRRFRGATIDDVPGPVGVWMDKFVSGHVVSATGPFSGAGLTIVASDLSNEEWATAIISDLVRRGASIYAPDVVVASLSEIHDDVRADRTNRDIYRSAHLLVVTSITVDDTWAVNTLASILESRGRRGLPAIALVDSDAWGVLNSARTPSRSLTVSLESRNVVVSTL